MTTTIVKTSILCGAVLATAVAGALTSTEAEAKSSYYQHYYSKYLPNNVSKRQNVNKVDRNARKKTMRQFQSLFK